MKFHPRSAVGAMLIATLLVSPTLYAQSNIEEEVLAQWPGLAMPREWGAAASDGNLIYYFGGNLDPGGVVDPQRSILSFDPITGESRETGALLPNDGAVALLGLAAQWAPSLGRFLVVGDGMCHGGLTAPLTCIRITTFNPATGSVSTLLNSDTFPTGFISQNPAQISHWGYGAVWVPPGSLEAELVGEGAAPAPPDGLAASADSCPAGCLFISGPLNGIVRYDVLTATFALVAEFPTLGPLDGTTAVWTGERMLIFGGMLPAVGVGNTAVTRGEASPDIYEFDPLTGALSIKGAALPSGRMAVAATWLDGQAILFGGVDLVAVINPIGGGQMPRFFGDILSYDPIEDRLEQRGSLSLPAGFAAAAVAEDRAYVLGGFNLVQNTMSSVWSFSWQEALPVASAGEDQFHIVNGDQAVVGLDGSGSHDPGGILASLSWHLDGTLLAQEARPTVPLPLGEHRIALEVRDMTSLTAQDEVVIKVVRNLPPIADAGTDKSVTDADSDGSALVLLNGSRSSDDHFALQHEWLRGGVRLGKGEETRVPLSVGVHEIQLKVTDELGLSATDTVLVRVLAGSLPPPNSVPLAEAGADHVAVADSDGDGSERIQLDASMSDDPDGSITHYAWSMNGRPTASGQAAAVNLPVGSHRILLTVTDDGGATSTDEVMVVVEANRPPAADAGLDQVLIDTDGDGTAEVTLDGTGSADPDGGITRYVWSREGQVVLQGAAGTVGLPVGTHSILLQVEDQAGRSGSDEVQVRVKAGAPSLQDVAVTHSCRGLSCEFEGLLEHEAATIEWDFGDGTFLAGKDRMKHTFEHEGNYTVRLRATGSSGTSVEAILVAVSEDESDARGIPSAGPILLIALLGALAFAVRRARGRP